MHYAKYGKNGPEISRLGFGAMRLPPRKKGEHGSVNFSKSVAVMRLAMEAGVNFFDSHHQYHNGLSEVAIGKALKGWKGHRIYIQTKTSMYKHISLSDRKKMVEEALEKTGVNCIDYLLAHSMTKETFKLRGKDFFKLTDWAMKKGYIQYRGFSSHDSPENIKSFIDTGEFTVMLVSYNYLNPQLRSLIDYVAKKGIGVTVMNPVGGSGLAANTKQILKLLPGAKTGAEVALRYVLDTPGVTCALSGMNTIEQVEENTHVASRKTLLTSKQWQVMKKGLRNFETQSSSICTACGYCMPCPHGVDIPGNFIQLNQAKFLGLNDSAASRISSWRKSSQGDKSAFACRQCGKCLPKCPNKIPIIEQLEEIVGFVGNRF